jgi:glycosyltransferase involved in cell wall biosynthesis
MGKDNLDRIKIGLPFLGDYKHWAGGVIYIINLISALKTLEEANQPHLMVYHLDKSPIEDIKAIQYPHIEFILVKAYYNILEKAANFILVKFFKTSVFFPKLPDVFYPHWRISVGKKPLHWIADFQEHHLPQMFSEAEILKRKKIHTMLSKEQSIIVFSSNDAMNDFKNFYPHYKNDLKLLQFASTLPNYKDLDITALKKEFGLTQKYFFSPNQFWKHKNHMVILKAIHELKSKNLDFQIAFSGSESDYRNKDYFQQLKNYIQENKLEKWVQFLGFIDRKKQLQLMNHAIAIIQPSLFEGWSTVVEDAKALNQYIILSNLKVHQEQISQNCTFFEPMDYKALATIIEKNCGTPPVKHFIDYQENIINFAQNFLKIAQQNAY